MNKLKIDNWLIHDAALTLRNFSHSMTEWDKMTYAEKSVVENPYILAANAMLIVAKQGFGDCFDIDDFIENVNAGGFIDYDGIGFWVDKEGNELGQIRCDVDWLNENMPTNAAFIMWYNK